jgi:hypothetical protein
MSDKHHPVEKPKEPIKSNNPTDAELKERAVNPRAMRPDNVKVTVKAPNEKVNTMKKLFGF